MKRTNRLNRISRTNSNPWKNKPLFSQYKLDNPIDELAKYFPMHTREGSAVPLRSSNPNPCTVTISRYSERANQCHHITGGLNGARRWDLVTNLIHLSDATHDFCEAYQVDGVVLCIRAKLDKGEWDWTEIDRIMGTFNVRGWLQTKDVRFGFVKPVLTTLFSE